VAIVAVIAAQSFELELELELILSHMTQKPIVKHRHIPRKSSNLRGRAVCGDFGAPACATAVGARSKRQGARGQAEHSCALPPSSEHKSSHTKLMNRGWFVGAVIGITRNQARAGPESISNHCRSQKDERGKVLCEVLMD
jgi:hypothetical protein